MIDKDLHIFIFLFKKILATPLKYEYCPMLLIPPLKKYHFLFLALKPSKNLVCYEKVRTLQVFPKENK